MGRKRKTRRQTHGSAWHWQQTDCWYYTLPGTKKRIALFDEAGLRIRGRENKEAAELALAKEKLALLSVTTFCTFSREFSPAQPAQAPRFLWPVDPHAAGIMMGA